MEQLKSRIEAVLFVTAKVLQIKDIAEKYNLIVTGGTDCHTRNIMSY